MNLNNYVEQLLVVRLWGYVRFHIVVRFLTLVERKKLSPTVSIHSFGGSLDALAGHVLGALDRLALGAGQLGAVLRLHAQPVHGGCAHDRISA